VSRGQRNGSLRPLKLAVTSPTSGGRSVGLVRLRTKCHGVFYGLLDIFDSAEATTQRLDNQSNLGYVAKVMPPLD
jgi:hypothetical protein